MQHLSAGQCRPGGGGEEFDVKRVVSNTWGRQQRMQNCTYLCTYLVTTILHHTSFNSYVRTYNAHLFTVSTFDLNLPPSNWRLKIHCDT
jgi:hypothetical protein